MAVLKRPNFERETVNRLTPHYSAPAKWYGLLKICKENFSLTLVVNSISSPHITWLNTLARKLSPTVVLSEHIVRIQRPFFRNSTTYTYRNTDILTLCNKSNQHHRPLLASSHICLFSMEWAVSLDGWSCHWFTICSSHGKLCGTDQASRTELQLH